MIMINTRALQVEKDIRELRDSINAIGSNLGNAKSDAELDLMIDAVKTLFNQLQIDCEDLRLMLADAKPVPLRDKHSGA